MHIHGTAVGTKPSRDRASLAVEQQRRDEQARREQEDRRGQARGPRVAVVTLPWPRPSPGN